MSTRRGFLDFLFARKESGDVDDTAYSSVAPPPLPLAKRLNRNALTVAAVLMGITVMTSLVVFNTGNGGANAAVGATSPVAYPPSQPTFLELPVRGNVTGGAYQGAIAGDSSVSSGGVPVSQARQGTSPYKEGVYPPSYAPPEASDWGSDGSNPPTGRPSARRQRDQAFAAALRRSAVAGGSEVVPANVAPTGVASGGFGASTAGAEERLLAYSDSVMRDAMSFASPGGTASASHISPPSSSRRAFLRESGDLGGRSVVARLDPAGSPFTLRAGTVIPGVLLTAITSTLPGECVGQVARDVFDSKSQRILLIPKGSKLICRYDDQVAVGQGRLLIAWTRLILPDGRSMTLPGLALKDRQGRTGAQGEVDNHTGQVFGSAVLLSAISAGAQLSQPRQTSVFAAPSAGQVVAGALGQELSNVALEILRRGMSQPPTITVPQGQSFNVFLNGDLVFDGAYESGW